jgi:glycosyltransferase involved in cell wall biosynthesis
MRVLIFTQYFTPEIGATQTRLHTFARGLADRGHDVHVICEVPNHPQGVVREGFRGRLAVRRSTDGFRAVHLWVRASPRKTRWNRLAFYGSYMALAAIAGIASRRPDVVFASSPPLPVAAAAAAVAARHRVAWIMDVRDLWPEAAVAMGELGPGRTLRAAQRLERRLYRSASAITAVTPLFADAIASRGGNGKVTLLQNGTTPFWVDGATLEPDREALGLPRNRFLWTFAGNVGAAQGLEAAVEAAALLPEKFHLLVLGDGPARERLERIAEALPRGSAEFRGQVEPPEARQILRASDALLVPLAPDPILRAFVPSKFFDFCALGRPVIVATGGETERLAADAGAALTVPPGDPHGIATAVRQLSGDPAVATTLGRAAQIFAANNLRDRQVEILEGLLESAAASGRAGVPCRDT